MKGDKGELPWQPVIIIFISSAVLSVDSGSSQENNYGVTNSVHAACQFNRSAYALNCVRSLPVWGF